MIVPSFLFQRWAAGRNVKPEYRLSYVSVSSFGPSQIVDNVNSIGWFMHLREDYGFMLVCLSFPLLLTLFLMMPHLWEQGSKALP